MSLFYRYDKEGPGVSKDAPKKKTFFLFFETFFRNIWKLIPLNFLYWILSIIPVGFSAVGITYVTRSISRQKHTFGLSDFFTAVKKNWKQAVGVGLINNLILAFIVFDIRFFNDIAKNGDIIGSIGVGLFVAFFIIFFVMKFYIWFLVITFNFKIGQIYLNSLKFVVVNLKNNIFITLSIVAFWALLYGIFLIYPTPFMMALLCVIIVFFYPTYRYLVIQFGVFGSIKKCIIDPYYAEHPDDDIEFRRNLGIYEEPEDESEISEEQTDDE